MRWYQALKYPDGISVEEGEKWYLEVHSQKAKEQPGLLRYVSHRVLENLPIVTPRHRVTEMWYQDSDAWRKEEPFVDMTSTFVLYKPDVNLLRDNPLIS